MKSNKISLCIVATVFFLTLLGIPRTIYANTPFCGLSGQSGTQGTGNSCVHAACENGNYECAFCVTAYDFNQSPGNGCQRHGEWWNSWECQQSDNNIWGACGGRSCVEGNVESRGKTWCDTKGNPNPTATPPPATTPTPTTIPTPIPDPPPYGWDGLACSVGQSTGTSSGWACDPSDYSVSLLVDTFVDGAWIYRTLANGSWPGVAGACGGYDNHAFSVTIDPAYFADNQAHRVQSKAVNIGTNGPYWTEISDWTGTNHAPQTCYSSARISATPQFCQIPYDENECLTTINWGTQNEGTQFQLYQNSRLVVDNAPVSGIYTAHIHIPPSNSWFDLRTVVNNGSSPSQTIASTQGSPDTGNPGDFSSAKVGAIQLHAIFGSIGSDTNNDGSLEGNEMLNGIRIRAVGTTTFFSTTLTSAHDTRYGRGDGFISSVNIPPDVYTLSIDPSSLPANVSKTNLPNMTIDLRDPANKISDRQYVLLPDYTIRGTVFIDTNLNHVYDPGIDPVYTGSISIGTSTGGTVSYGGSGAYTISHASTIQNQYIQFSGVPAGYLPTTPTTQSTSPCLNTTGDCIINFGIINSNPWYQTKGLDVRVDPWQKDVIPSQSVCANQPYASTLNANNTPGVTFGGSVDQTFGAGSASAYNWQAGNSQYPETFPSLRRTSVSYVRQTIKQLNTPQVGLNSFGGCGNYADCHLSGIPTGTQANPKIYVADYGGSVNLNADRVDITSGSVIIIVTGTLTINGEIHVAPGASLTFITANIIIASSIGSSPISCSPAPNLEGFYSADGSINIQSSANCAVSVADKQLSVAGSLVANAGKAGGTLRMSRDMCLDNVTFPSVTVSERPDLALTLPLIFQQNYSLFKEVAP